ncbi:uncharacterized protein LOC123684811 isoform X2 [Harmonia axyridis]|uniref:uncharacterized protein LOC123684811 isoform X2 n=1 Tax=Harmonia axyridis TaxID=115357 RepID=UPI001E2750B6|nr:uncharacterized protein LOC123684811 isoform X2 [Harmonia axyridis]
MNHACSPKSRMNVVSSNSRPSYCLQEKSFITPPRNPKIEAFNTLRIKDMRRVKQKSFNDHRFSTKSIKNKPNNLKKICRKITYGELESESAFISGPSYVVNNFKFRTALRKLLASLREAGGKCTDLSVSYNDTVSGTNIEQLQNENEQLQNG